MLEKDSILLMIGDSITDCERNYGAEPGVEWSLGNGYVNLIYSALTAFMPEFKIMVVNKGVSGNTIRNLKERWQQDVLDLNPDYVSIMIGVNDAWRHFDKAIFTKFPQVTYEEYENTYRELIEKTRHCVKDMYIFSPFMIEPNKEEPMSRMVREFASIAKKLAGEYKLHYVDVQATMDEFTEKAHSYVLSSDRVHPSLQGHMIIAKTFLKSIEFNI